MATIPHEGGGRQLARPMESIRPTVIIAPHGSRAKRRPHSASYGLTHFSRTGKPHATIRAAPTTITAERADFSA